MGRAIDTPNWATVKLEEQVIWDSHNYPVIAADPLGFLHLSGNMHNSPLVYFRTRKPMDISTFKRYQSMTGSEEERVTYPKFDYDVEGNLIFMYRSGSTARGDHIFNRYSHEAQYWARQLFKPFSAGEDKHSAYFDEFQRGVNGYTHVCWVWRDTGDAATNNTLCYARSSDLRKWENALGEELTLPLTKDSPCVVDPVPSGGGLVNGSFKLGFTNDNRPVIAYTKYDSSGNNQIYVAGWTGKNWSISSLTEYDYRWEIGGRGIIGGEIGVRRPSLAENALSIQWTHKKFGNKRRLVNPETFAPGEMAPPLSDGIPKSLRTPISNYPDIQVRFSWDTGSDGNPNTKYFLRWETLPPNGDKARPRPWPEAQMMRVFKVATPGVEN